MIRLGLIGHPVAHSRSPLLHRAALRAAGLEGSYELFDTLPAAVAERVAALRASGFAGLNVTIPHKTTVLALADRVDPLAARIGAANTLCLSPDVVTAFNTDAPAFMDSLAQAFGDPSAHDVLVYGTGGAARAVIAALVDTGARVSVAGRRSEVVAALASELGARALDAGARPTLLVNASSAGLGLVEGSPEWCASSDMFARLPWDSASLGYDVIYGHGTTPFLAAARDGGVDGMGGGDMLVRQAAIAFELWTGVPRGETVVAMRAAFAGLVG